MIGKIESIGLIFLVGTFCALALITIANLAFLFYGLVIDPAITWFRSNFDR